MKDQDTRKEEEKMEIINETIEGNRSFGQKSKRESFMNDNVENLSIDQLKKSKLNYESDQILNTKESINIDLSKSEEEDDNLFI